MGGKEGISLHVNLVTLMFEGLFSSCERTKTIFVPNAKTYSLSFFFFVDPPSLSVISFPPLSPPLPSNVDLLLDDDDDEEEEEEEEEKEVRRFDRFETIVREGKEIFPSDPNFSFVVVL